MCVFVCVCVCVCVERERERERERGAHTRIHTDLRLGLGDRKDRDLFAGSGVLADASLRICACERM